MTLLLTATISALVSALLTARHLRARLPRPVRLDRDTLADRVYAGAPPPRDADEALMRACVQSYIRTGSTLPPLLAAWGLESA